MDIEADIEFEKQLAHLMEDVRQSVSNSNKIILHAIDNWNRAKSDPVAAIKSGDKLVELLSKFLKEQE